MPACEPCQAREGAALSGIRQVFGISWISFNRFGRKGTSENPFSLTHSGKYGMDSR